MSGPGTERTRLLAHDAVEVSVNRGDVAYPVLVRGGLIDEIPSLVASLGRFHAIAVISDETVAPLYGEKVVADLAASGERARLFTFPDGEASKTRRSWGSLTDRMIDAGYGRDTLVVAVGGGVTGDLAGFVAATFMRGVPVVQVPTSLVAMIDASVGGKTGVDTRAGKNLVGAFHPPRLVVADPHTTRTLPRRARGQGLAEAVKHGLILDAAYARDLGRDAEALLDGDPEATARAVRRSVELKGDVVSRDEREGGLRQILNFGHTLGHAIEASSDYESTHGSAVAVGMVLESKLGERLGVTTAGTSGEVADLLGRFGLPTGFDELAGSWDADTLLDFTGADKKRRGGVARYVLLRGVGEVDPGDGWSHVVPDDAVRSLLEGELR